MAWFTFGEGYHNFHHEFQHDYRNGVKPWQFDPTKWAIWLLHRLGLARHLRRVPAIVRLAQRHELPYTLRSSNRKGNTPLFILDSMGELSGLFARCDLVVMGGSFSRSVGGHNIIEPSFYRKS